jgi:hypothetical protein
MWFEAWEFRCGTCGLQLSDPSELDAAGIPDRWTKDFDPEALVPRHWCSKSTNQVPLLICQRREGIDNRPNVSVHGGRYLKTPYCILEPRRVN